MTVQFAPLRLFVTGVALAVSIAQADEWPRHTIEDRYRGADGVRLADVDGDGLLDIATPWEEGGRVTVAFDLGRDATPRWRVETLGRCDSVEDAVALDLFRDDQPLEVVSAAEGRTKRLVVSSTDEKGRWHTRDLPTSLDREQYMFVLPWETQTATAFITGGKNVGATISYWAPAGRADNISSWQPNTLRNAGWIMSLRRTDMNGDGRPDVLFSDRKGPSRGVGWLTLNYEAGPREGIGPRHDKGPRKETNRKETNYREVIVGATDHEPMFLTEADVDADGDQDVVVAVKDVGLIVFERLDESGERWTQRSWPMPSDCGTAKGVAVDTSHGRTEIFITTEHSEARSSIVRMTWDDSSRFARTAPFVDIPGGTVGTKFDRVELIDMDDDGDLDLLTCEEREGLGVIWYERPSID